MELWPLTIERAKQYVSRSHRHHRPPLGGLFALGAGKGGELVGVVIVGRPVARHLDSGLTAEVTRCCTDGTPNACSFLYGAAWRAARGLGYRRLVTYTLPEEGGASLRGAGWRPDHRVVGREWNHRHNPAWLGLGDRANDHPLGDKQRWAVEAHDLEAVASRYSPPPLSPRSAESPQLRLDLAEKA
jgi:hypothetical protein